MKNKRKNKGITLVALIITIIILLILAGISISALTNQGLFGKAKEAKEKYQIEKEKEEISLIIMEKEINNITTSEEENSIEKVFEKTDKTEIIKEDDGTYTVIKNDNIYKIDQNNNVKYNGKVGKIAPKIKKISKNIEDTTVKLNEIIMTIEVSTEDEQGLSSVKIKKEMQTGDTSKYYTYRVKNITGNTATVEMTIKSKGKYQIYAYGKNGTYTNSKTIEINNIYPKPEPPVISVTEGKRLDNGWFIGDVKIKIEAKNKENTTTLYTITGQEENTVENGIKELLINEDGIYEITAYTISEEGITSEEATLTIKRDTTAPEKFTPIDGTGNGTGTQIEIDANVEDISGIKEYKYYLNNKQIKATTEKIDTITGLQPFVEYELYIIAINNVGMQTTSEKIKFNTGMYLFNNGDECTEITGGWQGAYYVDYNKLTNKDEYYGNGFFNKNNNKLNFGDKTEYHGDGGYYTQNDIDCRNYAKLCMKGVYSCYWYDIGYSKSGTGFGILFNGKIAEGKIEKATKTNSIFNHELLLDLKDKDDLSDGTEHFVPICSSRDDYNGKITVMSLTSWQGRYTWYASISEIYLLK